MKLFLDDNRLPPDRSWVTVRNIDDALTIIMSGQVQIASLDHDLGDGFEDGAALTVRLKDFAANRPLSAAMILPQFHLHSSNPKGRDDMRLDIEAMERYLRREGHNRPLMLSAAEAEALNLPPSVPALIDPTAEEVPKKTHPSYTSIPSLDFMRLWG